MSACSVYFDIVSVMRELFGKIVRLYLTTGNTCHDFVGMMILDEDNLWDSIC